MAPPPKVRLHTNNSSGKLKTISKTIIPPATSQPGPSTSSGSVTENDQQFQLEIYWCIQQLEATLKDGKLNQKQFQETEKNIKILRSPAQPIIKKRQLMRQLFGDYRSKMAEEEQKLYSANRRIQFNAKTTPNKKSHFVKKSALLQALKNQEEFQFNFKLDDKLSGLKLNETDESEKLNVPATNNSQNASSSSGSSVQPTKFQQSGNEFRFNFNMDENQN